MTIPPPASSQLHLGPISLYWYSLVLLIALWSAYFLLLRQARRYQLTREIILDSLIVVLIGGVIGARLGYVLQNIPTDTEQWFSIIKITSGGLSIHGALIGGVIGLAGYARRHRLSLLTLTDCYTLPVLLGQVIGRFGNYFNQELYGYPTHLPWKLAVDPEYRPKQYPFASTFHPTFLYESLFNLIGLIVLHRLNLRKKGQLSLGYLVVFSLSRFLTEIWRISDRVIGVFSLAQLISLALLFGVLVISFYPYLTRDRKRTAD